MGFHTYTSTFEHSSDATFRTWGGDASAGMTTAGIPKTGDSGQINWGTVTRPGTNTAAGYEIRILNDSLHGTRPIYAKLEYGTGAATGSPGMWITLGTGSNGSGTLTGVFLAREAFALNAATSIGSTSTPYSTYMCAVDGCFWFAIKIGAFSSPGFGDRTFALAVMRTVDDDADINSDGAIVYVPSASNAAARARSYNFVTGYSRDTGTANFVYGGFYTYMPYAMTSTVASGVPGYYQSTRHLCVMPTIRPVLHVVSAAPGDAIALGTLVDDMPVGTTPHQYISARAAFSNVDHFFLIWE